jgi:hypothetical protein
LEKTTEKTEIVVRVVRLRGRWAGSGQVKDGLLFFFPLFFLLLISSSFSCRIILGRNKRGLWKEFKTCSKK